MPNSSDNSGLVNRNLRNAPNSYSVRRSVRLATVFGAEDLSSSPAGPSARYRTTHFEHVRALTPAACAACAIARPCSRTDMTIRSRPFRLSAALA